MTGREYVERIWQALRETRKSGIDPADFVVNVAPDVWADLRLEAPLNITTFDGSAVRVLGLQMVANPNLSDGEIVLRYEVQA